MKELEKRYRQICIDYLIEFYNKHEMEYTQADLDEWVGGVGENVCIGDCYFNFDDVRYDVDHNIEGDKIFDWYYNNLDHAEYGLRYINFPSYCKGAPDPVPQEEWEHIKELRAKLNELREDFEKACEDYKDPELKDYQCINML